ncbi:hypothetical protein HPB48_017368 [Haemaphysalis longicornis]|uniref:Uncharacterized protein n=1 Tax=Haemaphysalis longicornis TaxID=44386 RepID=A0A9J6GCD2_HAELO|nr:hypothetical protein HPB48_017368 [Haemaphysalis longicornis]
MKQELIPLTVRKSLLLPKPLVAQQFPPSFLCSPLDRSGMPFSIRRLTLQRSLSGGGGGERSSKGEPPGRAAIKKSASQDEARAARGALPSSRSADQGDLRRLQALGQLPSSGQASDHAALAYATRRQPKTQ